MTGFQLHQAIRTCLITLVGLALVASCSHHTAKEGDAPGVETLSIGLTGKRIPDVEFVDQQGRRVHFLSDVIKDNSVLMAFMFTSCRQSCPMTASIFARIQELLKKRPNSGVQLISISVDPENDSADKLQEWARRYGVVDAYWSVLGAPLESVRDVARALTGETVGKGDHIPIIMIGNRRTGSWKRAYGLDDPERLLSLAESPEREPFDKP